MPIEIHETTVTPGAAADVVRLRISDAPLGEQSGSFELTILAALPTYQAPVLAQPQRETLKSDDRRGRYVAARISTSRS